jgi:hypothetical protein
VFFDKETWSVDRLVSGRQWGGGPERAGLVAAVCRERLFSDAARRDLFAFEDKTDYLPVYRSRRARLRAEYRDFLLTTPRSTHRWSVSRADPRRVGRRRRRHSGDQTTFLAGFQGMGFPPPQGTERPRKHLPFPRRQRLDPELLVRR